MGKLLASEHRALFKESIESKGQKIQEAHGGKNQRTSGLRNPLGSRDISEDELRAKDDQREHVLLTATPL